MIVMNGYFSIDAQPGLSTAIGDFSLANNSPTGVKTLVIRANG